MSGEARREKHPKLSAAKSLWLNFYFPKKGARFGLLEPVFEAEIGETPGIRNYKREKLEELLRRRVIPLIWVLGGVILPLLIYGLIVLAPILFKALLAVAFLGALASPLGWGILAGLAAIALLVVVVAAVSLASRSELGRKIDFKVSSVREAVIALITPLELDESQKAIQATEDEMSQLRSSKVGEIEMTDFKLSSPRSSESLSPVVAHAQSKGDEKKEVKLTSLERLKQLVADFDAGQKNSPGVVLDLLEKTDPATLVSRAHIKTFAKLLEAHPGILFKLNEKNPDAISALALAFDSGKAFKASKRLRGDEVSKETQAAVKVVSEALGSVVLKENLKQVGLT